MLRTATELSGSYQIIESFERGRCLSAANHGNWGRAVVYKLNRFRRLTAWPFHVKHVSEGYYATSAFR